jgi:short-subunit dehydrogenase
MCEKTLWITGAGKGIGRAVAWEYVKHGWTVAVSSRTQADLDALIQEALAAKLPGRIAAFTVDVTDYDAVKQAFKDIEQDVGQIDQVIFNAGTHIPNAATNFNVASFRTLMEINFMGSVNGLSAVVPTFIARRAGHIAIVASVAGYCGLPLASAYGASKAALINMCEALKPEMEAAGVTLSVINPGFVRTPLTAKNKFQMPFLIDSDVAARHIYAGMAKGKFEIVFPLAFALILKALRMMPYAVYFAITRKIIPKSTGGLV